MKKEEQVSGNYTASDVDALVRETGQNVQLWVQEVDRLLDRLRSLAPGDQEEYFRTLLGQDPEKFSPLLEKLMGKDEQIDLALARSLGHGTSSQASVLLEHLASAARSKVVRKTIRKSLFRLRSRGLEVPDLSDSGPSVYHPPQPIPLEGFLSALDATGSRLVWFARPQPLQGIFAFHTMVSDVQGILDFNAFETSRKKFHDYLEEMRGNVPWEIVDADPLYCHALILQAAEINEKKGQPAPGEFLKWRPLMGPPPERRPEPLIYSYLSAEEAKNRPDMLDRSAALFDLPSFQTWFLEESELEKYLPSLKEASESRLVLTPYQKEARVMEIYRQVVQNVFDPARRTLYRGRLEEMAYVLWKLGRQDEGRVALTAALHLESEGGILSIHPFLLELVRRSFAAQLEEEEAKKKKKESELLIKPQT